MKPVVPYRPWLAVSIVLLVLFVLLAFAVKQTPYFAVDLQITHALQSFRSPALDVFMDAVGQPGFPPQTLVLNVLIVLIVFLCRLKREALVLLVAIPITGSAQTLVRMGLDRARPSPELVWVLHEIENRHFSFPSGHTVSFLAALGFLMFVAYTQLPSTWHRNLLLALYAIYIALVPISRVYVGDHWPSDVFGGLMLGSVFLIWTILAYEWLGARQKRSVRVPQRANEH